VEVKATDSFSCCPECGHDGCGFQDPKEGHDAWTEREDVVKRGKRLKEGHRRGFINPDAW
jgi:hypothetical protein